MLAFFRRILNSGVAVAILAVIILAFVITGIGTPGGGFMGGGARADEVAKVGGRPVTISEIRTRAQAELRTAARQQPGITMAQLLAVVGGAPTIVDQVVGAQVLTRWAEDHGLVAGKRLVDGEIASIPAFQGPAGTFDEQQMATVLGQQRMNFAELRDGVRDDLLRRQLLVPITTGARAPAALLNSYARLLLDKREGVIGLVPASSAAVPTPSLADVAAYYQSHLARYTLPDRRVVRYAPVSADTLAVTPPTDAEIAAYYKANAAGFAANETRTVSQVVLPDAAAAGALVAKVKGGTPFAKAAGEAGFAAGDISLGALSRDALAKASSPTVATAVFGARNGDTTAPVKTDLGYAVAHVDAVTARPARTLDQARAEIVAALSKKKGADALGTTVSQLQDALNDGANFDAVASRFKLKPVVTPPVVADGSAPSDPAFKPDPTLAALMKVAKDMGPEDAPTLETVGADGRYALLGVASIVRAAPVPLAEMRNRVAADLVAERSATRAKATAQALIARVAKGEPMAAAFAALNQPKPQPISISQMQAAQSGQNVPPAISALFRLTPGKTALVASPAGGWFVVKLDRVVPGDQAMLPAIAASTRDDLGRSLADEYAAQFAAAARSDVKVTRNPAAMAELERQLRGGSPDAGQ